MTLTFLQCRDRDNFTCFPAIREAAMTEGNVIEFRERWSDAVCCGFKHLS